MNRIAKIIVGLALTGALLWGLFQLIPTEEKRLQRRLHQVAELMTITGREGNLARIATLNTFGGCFTPDTQINLTGTGFGSAQFNGRAEVQATATALMSQGYGIEVVFSDILVKVSPDRQTATAELTARVNVRGERDFGLQELRIQLRKVEGAWQIAQVDSFKTFEQ